MTRLAPILGISLLALWQLDVIAADVKPQDAVTPEFGVANPVTAHPFASLSATRDRPLFSPSRRPPPAPFVRLTDPTPVPPAPPALPPSIALVGIITEDNGSFAVVRADPSTNKSIRVRIGDQIEGWTVTQITKLNIILSRDGRIADFSLFKGRRAPRPIGRMMPTIAANQPIVEDRWARMRRPSPE
jgi:hypothetical protein